MEQRASQPYALRLAKVCYGKALSQMMADTIKLPPDVYQLLSAGGQQIVYATDTKVAKVITHSLSFDEKVAESHAVWYQANYNAAEPHVADHIVKTDFDIKSLRNGLFAAIALQPRTKPTREFQDVNDMVTYRDDDAYMDQLRSLFDALTNLYQHKGLQLDLNGPRNLHLEETEAGPAIRVVDTIVVSPNLQAVVDQTRGMTTGQTIIEKMNILEGVVSRPQVV